MIKKFIFPLIAIILLSSCANKFSVQKRKYNKGFYLGMSGNHHNKTDHASPSNLKTKHLKDVSVDEPQNEIVSAPVNIEVLSTVKQIAKENKIVQPKYDKHVVANSGNTLMREEKKFRNIEFKDRVTKTKLRKGGGGDTNLIVLVILSLFPILCLIAVFLHDGKSITLNFWIDLLLHITVIGEVIFALLVVLDVIDLA